MNHDQRMSNEAIGSGIPSVLRRFAFGGLALLMSLLGTHAARAQQIGVAPVAAHKTLPPAVEQALSDTNRTSLNELAAIEAQLRTIFRNSRNRDQLKRFVDEILSFFEKFRQFGNIANPATTEARVGALFRQRIMDEETVCGLLEKSLASYCQSLNNQDQALLIKLKIDREFTRANLSRAVIDPAAFKQPIRAAASSTVTAVKNDIARTVASFVASEAISMGVKRAARDLGVMPGERGSAADILSGLLIDIGVGMAVDAATDPTSKMVSDLETRLTNVEREILDGTVGSPGFITKLRQITQERAAARRKLIEAEFSK